MLHEVDMESLRHQFERQRFGIPLNERERIERVAIGGFREMVAGFCFDDTGHNLALIEKQKPEWQIGKFNAIGGKIEINEHKSHIDNSVVFTFEEPELAMEREFYEEAGEVIESDEWSPCVTLSGKDFVVYFFKVFNTEHFCNITTNENEIIYKLTVANFLNNYKQKLISNLQWMIPLCLDLSLKHIHIQES